MALSRETLARRIRDALGASGMSQRILAEYVQMEESALSKALSGRRGLSSLEVARIAERLGLRTDALFADDDAAFIQAMTWAGRVQEGIAGAGAVAEAVAVAGRMAQLDQLLRDVAPDDREAPAVPTLGRGNAVLQGERLADAVRKMAGLGTEPLPEDVEGLARWVENRFGVDVCIAPLPKGVDGLALSGGGLRLIVVSSKIPATRQRFTMMHELCHVLAGDGKDLVVDEDVLGAATAAERRANAFAAAVLVPSRPLREAVEGRTIDITLVVELLARYRVSLEMLAFRLHNVGAINAAERDSIRRFRSGQIAARPGRSADLQALNEYRAPQLLLDRALLAFAHGQLGVEPLSTLLKVDPDQLLDDLTPPRFKPWTEAEAAYSP